MRRNKTTIYDAQESKILQQSSSFMEFLTRKGVLEDQDINDEKIRKAKQDTAQKAYHNTKVLLEQYRTILWVLECVPGEIAMELRIPTKMLDDLAEKVDLEMTLENKRIENRLSAALKTRILLDRLQDALTVLRKMPETGERLYELIYATYISPIRRKHAELLEQLHLSTRTYYRLRHEAISIMSIRLWSAPSSDIDDWLEVLTLLQSL